MKRRSSLPITREVQIKITISYHLIPVRVAIIKKQKITNVDEVMQKLEPLNTVGKCNGAVFMENNVEILQKY